ncbi:MlaD family protein [Rhodoferax sp.]|uniref:MlaD family protein n=1 Tax=Rhodoferax sp. TaxID=50421 RepID=UPI00284875F6|nr:MlaD family protein [Rhodoferax sp.]MDR3368532.1 MlaD family protein [Rhodoferax sp.]
MKTSARALRLGSFVVLGIVLLVALVVFVLSGELLTRREVVLMRFTGSVYGLSVGSPVVFRGVNVGAVKEIGLARNGKGGQIEIPVRAALNQAAALQLAPQETNGVRAIEGLIARGLSARLASQSLLTGQLYVDLDLRPGLVKPNVTGTTSDLPDIPTVPSTLQAFQSQLEGIDLKAAFQDVAAIAQTGRQLLQDPQLKTTLTNLAKLSTELQTLAQSVQREVKPLSGAARATLAQVGTAANALTLAGERVTQAGESVTQVAQRLSTTLAPDAPLLQSFQHTADELSRTAQSLRHTAGNDSELVQNINRAASDVARAARQLGDLADLLQRQPDALLRGRAAAP